MSSMPPGGCKASTVAVSVLWAALWVTPAVGAQEDYDHEVPLQCSSFAISPAPGVGRSVTVCATAGLTTGTPTPPVVESRRCAMPYGAGFTIHTGDGSLMFCVSYTSQVWTPDVSDLLGGTGTQNCPLGFVGIAVLVGDGGHASVCVQFEFRVPHTVFPIATDLTPCTAQALDPAIFIGDGGLRICVVFQSWPPGFDPPIGAPVVDLSPCDAGSDPRVTVGEFDVAVCIESDAQAPSGAPVGGLDDPCDHGVSFNSTAAGQTGRVCVAVQP